MSSPHLLSPRGFRAGASYAGIKTTPTLDVGLLVCESPATAAALFSTNNVVSPGVVIGRKHIAPGRLRGVVVNSGNANACTGRRGLNDAITMCRLAGQQFGCDPHQVLPSSTGIIGHHLPMDKIAHGIAAAGDYLGDSEEHALRFAESIMTTDLKRKSAAVEVKIGRDQITLAGVCKGSGMIGPRLGLHATMLAYLTTDAKIPPPLLRKLLKNAADVSFNCVTVDDHASTNDTLCILASGLGPAVTKSNAHRVAMGLTELCQSLAYQIAADGEGATKVVRIDVSGTATDAQAKAIARTIANSPLVKCAMHGNDPNWGRIVSAAGMAGVPFNSEKSVLKLQGTIVFRKGQPVTFDAKAVSESLAAPEVVVDLSCGSGKRRATVWTCDLSKEYVTINADYHT